MAYKPNGVLEWIATLLVILGSLNWLFVAFGFNLLEFALNGLWLRTAYILIGISGIYCLYMLWKSNN